MEHGRLDTKFANILFELLCMVTGLSFANSPPTLNPASLNRTADTYCVLPRIIPNSTHNVSAADSFKIPETGEVAVAVGTTVRYRCDFTYVLQGFMDTYKCMPSGRWSSNAFPICELIACPLPPKIDNGRPLDDPAVTTVGTRVKYVCDDGYSFYFWDSLYCNSFGQWEATIGQLRCLRNTRSSFDVDDDSARKPPRVYNDGWNRKSVDMDNRKAEFAVAMMGIMILAGAILCCRKGGACRQGVHDGSGPFEDIPIAPSSDGNPFVEPRRATSRAAAAEYASQPSSRLTQTTPTILLYSFANPVPNKVETPPPRYEELPPSYEEAMMQTTVTHPSLPSS